VSESDLTEELIAKINSKKKASRRKSTGPAPVRLVSLATIKELLPKSKLLDLKTDPYCEQYHSDTMVKFR